MRVQMTCPVCGSPDARLNTETGWVFCYSGCRKKVQRGAGVRREDVELAPPPRSSEISAGVEDYLRQRLERAGKTLHLPAQVRETHEGLLFLFPHSDYWQVRVHSPLNNRRWICPPGGHSVPYVAEASMTGTVWDRGDELVGIRRPELLVVVEGIMDALKIYQLGFSALGILTTVPRRDQITPYTDRFSRLLWMPDGDVTLPQVKLGSDVLSNVWRRPINYHRLPKREDPCSMSADQLLRIITSV